MTELVAGINALTLTHSGNSPVQHLPFRPSVHCSLSQDQLDEIDGILYRLFDSDSEGFNDETWVKSRDATLLRGNSTTDILSRQDINSVAAMLSRHLWWKGKNDEEDNLVSWTSSFLFVLQYALYRSRYNGTSLKRIYICVVDTTQLPANVFVRDIDLINAYSHLDDKLARMRHLRQGPHYFGEYLSQGALYIAEHCSIVTMQDIVDAGVFQLRPEFEDFETRPAVWASEVVRLRQLDARNGGSTPIDGDHIEIADHVADLFGAHWRWPVILACLGLKAWQDTEIGIMESLQLPTLAGLYFQ